MGVASGTTSPDGGTITVRGQLVDRLTPGLASELGVAIVHQHPAVLPDMTVAENLQVAVPARFLRGGPDGGDGAEVMRRMLADVGSSAHLDDRVRSLSVAQKHLLELAKALAVKPSILILDEPTAPLGQEAVTLLFDRVRRAAEGGTAVVYITHRLAEVRELASRVTVLRDGKLRGTARVDEITDDDLLALIVGRQLDSTFPAKPAADDASAPLLVVDGLTGPGFSDVSFSARRGEIVGVSGVVGNGQSALLRALAGLEPFTGTLTIGARGHTSKRLLRTAGYLPADRHREGLMMSLSVRENAAVSALPRFRRGPLLDRGAEVTEVSRELASLAVKAPSPEATVSSLSGGNQQKVVLARALLSRPSILVADEPTQGVDVGARAEIYRILREVSENGVPVVVASSDAKELEGLCDRVVVMSRGAVVETLAGEEITEQRLINAAVRATGHSRQATEAAARPVTGSTRASRFLQGDYAPVIILALVMLALGGYVLNGNARYLSAFNITSVMTSCAALGFIAMGQTIALLIGGIDLSVGPLSGFLVVVASFFVNDGSSPLMMLTGFVLMFVGAGVTGALNGSLVRFARFTPVAATLVTYIALQGASFLLRDAPGGNIAGSVTGAIATKVGPVPVVFVVLILATLAMEYLLRYRGWGLRLRAVGSDEESAAGSASGSTAPWSWPTSPPPCSSPWGRWCCWPSSGSATRPRAWATR